MVGSVIPHVTSIETMQDDFYSQFEDQFRSSRSDIKARLSVYHDFLNALKIASDERKALDLGCGRGEWLETLQQFEFDAQGVDVDEGMLEPCRAQGLSVKQADAIETLKELEDNSVAVISAFHLVEHIPFDQLLELMTQARRALVPGGLLIMETPNPENLSVGTSSFYLDPTHNKPIPHALLAFSTRYCGFGFQKVLRVNEPSNYRDDAQFKLTDVLTGVSPDYAVIAVKTDDQKPPSVYKPLFDRDYGVALETLAQQYDDSRSRISVSERIQTALAITDEEVFALSCKLDDTADAAQREHELNQHQNESIDHLLTENTRQNETLHRHDGELEHLQSAIQQLQVDMQQNHQMRVNLTNEVLAMQASTSWRITRPLRAVAKTAKSVRQHGLRGFTMPLFEYANTNPSRRAKTAKWLRRFGFRKTAQKLSDSENKQ
ncbi:MAG TPA: methyltransferase domain-containing protein [Orrella sp.]